MVIELEWQGTKFLPAIHGLKENYFLIPEEETINLIKQEAFLKNSKLKLIGDILIKITLGSGVCSGLSAMALLDFLGEKQGDLDLDLAILIMQVRTWGRPFIYQGFKSYFNRKTFSEELKKALLSKNWEIRPLIVFLPRMNNIHKISYAHTVVPYCLKEGLSTIVIRVYDSNYPGDNGLFIKINKITGEWSYQDKEGNNWVLTINYLKNLIKKVPFLW